MHLPVWLTTLLESGSVGYTTANRKLVNELMRLGIITIKSAGSRRTVVVNDPPQLIQWCGAKYPQRDTEPEGLACRGENIVRSGNSKTGRSSHTVLPFQFKWFGDLSDPLTNVTLKNGMTAFLTDRLTTLALPDRWQLLTIENWEPFLQASYADSPDAVMVVYLGGNVSDVVIRALKKLHPAPRSSLHFGDFDWDGLYIFQRLQKVVSSMRLYIPDNIETLFAEFGNRRLIERQTRRSGFDMKNRDCLPVIQLIEMYNAGVEQEIVDLPNPLL